MRVADAGLGLLLGGVLIWMVLVVTQRTGVASALGASSGLVAVAALLAGLGAAVGALMGWQLTRGNPALCIGLGQCVLMTWFAWRSLVARVAEGVGIALPGCHDAELAGFALLLIGLAVWLRRMGAVPGRRAGIALPLFVLAAVAAVALSELPRQVAPTSDPDQHAFFTQQLYRLGQIPWQQGEWGPLDFQYPAGLALLARIWMLGGAVNGVEAVMVQPLVQSLLAVAALGIWFGQRREAEAVQSEGWRLGDAALLGAVIASTLFFSMLPFSMLASSKGLEKTGSLSSLLLLVLLAALLLEAWLTTSARSWRAAFCACALLLGLTALVNPVTLLLPLAAGLLVLAALRWRSRQPTMLLVLVGGVLFVTVLMSDPYYLNRFLLSSAPKALDVPPGFQPEPMAPPATEYLQYLRQHLTSLAWLRPWFLIPYLAHAVIALGVLAAGLAALATVPRDGRRAAAVVMLGVPVGCTLLGLLLLPVFHVLRHRGDMYLLEPYLADAISRAAYVWLFAVLLFALITLLTRFRLDSRWRCAALVLLLLAVMPLAVVRERLPTEIRMKSRVNWCGDTPCDFSDDIRLIQDGQGLLRAADGKPSPRILVPNRQLDIWRERWLLPVGFARALPIHLDAPLAFFYGKGDADFTYASYDEHVCKRLDVDWLRARRVEYLFVPSDHAKACVAGLEQLLASDRVVLRRGRAALIRL